MYLITCLNDDGTERLGTGCGNQIIIRELKTLRGVLNRIKKYNLNQNRAFNIYKGADIYNLNLIYTGGI